jgi:hypothetical protein
MSFAKLRCCVMFLIVPLLGCHARPAPDAGFLQDTQLIKPDKNFPFDRTYVNPKFTDKSYSEVYVAPVDANHMLKLNLWEVFSTAYLFPPDVRKNELLLAQYTHDAFVKAIEQDPSRRYTVVDHPGPNTIVVELAIVEVTPSKPLLYLYSYYSLAAYAASYIVPFIFNSDDQANGLIAMEGRVRDGETGDVVAMFADRQRPPIVAINLKALAWWEPVKPIIDTWAKQFDQVIDGERGKQIKEYPTWAILVM